MLQDNNDVNCEISLEIAVTIQSHSLKGQKQIVISFSLLAPSSTLVSAISFHYRKYRYTAYHKFTGGRTRGWGGETEWCCPAASSVGFALRLLSTFYVTISSSQYVPEGMKPAMSRLLKRFLVPAFITAGVIFLLFQRLERILCHVEDRLDTFFFQIHRKILKNQKPNQTYKSKRPDARLLPEATEQPKIEHRLHLWSMVPNPKCPNCGQMETNPHVFRDCSVARSFWGLIHHGLRTLGIRNYVNHSRNPRCGFALLFLAIGQHALWQNRCVAVCQDRRIRAMWPLISRLGGALYRHLDSELFSAREKKFLRRWS
ncbi:uncharacterized protein ISCGN_026602 [Ixodes scapularis]